MKSHENQFSRSRVRNGIQTDGWRRYNRPLSNDANVLKSKVSCPNHENCVYK